MTKKPITSEVLEKISKLSKLNLSKEEADKLLVELNNIMTYVDVLSKIDTKNVEAMSHVEDTTNVFREDIMNNSLETDDALKNSPSRSGGYFKTPIIVEGA